MARFFVSKILSAPPSNGADKEKNNKLTTSKIEVLTSTFVSGAEYIISTVKRENMEAKKANEITFMTSNSGANLAVMYPPTIMKMNAPDPISNPIKDRMKLGMKKTR